MKRYLSPLLLLLAASLGACSVDNTNLESPANNGKGGSMARFAVSADKLYTVNDRTLRFFDITDAADPVFMDDLTLGFGIETIFPYKNTLFIGSETGMYIYDISVPGDPKILSHYQHLTSCDPVVADEEYAYVTLRSGSECRWGWGPNLLQVIDIKDLRKPTLVAEYPMVNPKGLGIENKKLFVCDQGLQVYDVNPEGQLALREQFNVEAYDVIPYNGRLLLIGADGLYQYSFTNSTMALLSQIKVNRKN